MRQRKQGYKTWGKFTYCVENEMTAEIVNEHLTLSEELNIVAIPTIMMNGCIIEGAAPYEYLDRMVNYLTNM